MDGNRKKVGGCTLGSYALDVKCEDCSRLTAARKTAVPDRAGWYNAKRALPDPGERVIVTDGVFVGEAYLSKGGIWLRYGMEMVDRRTGIFPPVAWMPLPVFLKP